ncbi:glycolate oxidase subunit GlcF [Polymorphobacter fuscus]|uniref:Glycolate oxidase iron-sulfur subunit n=1 Tax=Sandarakinorhabdus fusca TaxID=1439888 RepID=A0A7C9KXV4_9SPHN|nr:glycolate oxidase subunit GlcF [Polymorphobacter fuscus]KAB7646269.1 glycolate oxidase subunit GlcF [Polymorphobacter fuscus]MQT17486.1 glycolate oxidase subunit GlcF [Polymorphobacter fuscus]NJC09975.1 glycolate oxidase iron-sulfur subunit [Polymorphobacter fuscus]
MQTDFTPEQRADPAMAASEGVIRKCVHCGFCTATCPTYLLLGDELDSPRGRIYLIKDMLENERVPSAEVVKHIDRCLSCLSCMTTCPSGVNYMHLVDHARAYINDHHQRRWTDRAVRGLLAWVLPSPGRFRLAVRAAALGRPLAPLLARFDALKPVAAMLALAPRSLAPPVPAQSTKAVATRGRVALLQGCAEPVLRPEFRAAAIRLLNRAGLDVVFAPGEQCCGALVHHMGREADALTAARRNVDAWTREIEEGGLIAIVVTTSGCGTTIKNYGFMLRDDADYADKAARVSALARDISEVLVDCDLPAGDARGLTVAYHPACSLQHGQKIVDAPKRLLARAGFTVRTPADAHLCCGSAGTYNILQPDIAGQLGDRKVANLARLDADVIATGNIGCATQIGQRTATPVVHTIELIDWATGGPVPIRLAGRFSTTDS